MTGSDAVAPVPEGRFGSKASLIFSQKPLQFSHTAERAKTCLQIVCEAESVLLQLIFNKS